MQKKKMQKKVAPVQKRTEKQGNALKSKALALIAKGWETSKIRAKHPELTTQQIAAYRAHVTMGTYR